MKLIAALLTGVLLAASTATAKRVAYIHGDVAPNGTIPSGTAAPYDQMLLTDSGSTGMSIYRALIEAQGYSISQHYDLATTLDSGFLQQFDVIVFGLHQKTWSAPERAALNAWILDGGGILMCSDSAAGGHFAEVGIRNQTGQTAVNSILAAYGMQVTVDQGGGTRAYTSSADATNPIVWDRPVLEGEGVSPITVDPDGTAKVLIPFDSANQISGGSLSIDTRGITIANPIWASLALNRVGEGNVMAIFDRQPFWNNGPGSDIEREDNTEVLRRIVRFLARDYGNSSEWLDFRIVSAGPPDFRVSYRQWADGTGQKGFDYVSRNTLFALEQQNDLRSGEWQGRSGLSEEVATDATGDGESERVTLRILPSNGADRWFARVSTLPLVPEVTPVVRAGRDLVIAEGGRAKLEGSLNFAGGQTWSRVSGPGTVSFANANAVHTTATFATPGRYELKLEAIGVTPATADTLTVTVADEANIVLAINCGGGTHDGLNGFDYAADIDFNGGGIDAFPGNAVAGTDDDILYNYARSKSGFTGYTIPVPDGNYLVVLQFAETFFTADNQRIFDVAIEGNLAIDR
jgi:hypothetical protein